MTGVWVQWLMVATGGAFGGALRYAVSGWFAHHLGESFPWGTLFVNVSGAALLGLLTGRLALESAAGHDLWLLLGVGAIGSYTTVSALSLQMLLLLKARQLASAAGYLGLSLLLGLAAGAFGLWAGSR